MSWQRRGVKSEFPRDNTGGATISDAEASPEEIDLIVLDKETWGNHELFEVICSRYFELGNQGAFPSSWEVVGIGGKGTSEQLLRLNDHLYPMGVVGSLEDTNPPTLTISKLPLGNDVLQKWHQGLIWVVMAVFLTWVGSHWSSRYGHESDALLDLGFEGAVLYFTAPILITLVAASHARAVVARRFGVEVGSLVPIVFPIPAWWSFGLIGVVGQKRPDLVPMPNRKALGSVEVVAPLVMSLSGFVLTVVGLLITPSEPPELTESPTVFEASLLAESLAESWMGEQMGIRMQWLHPLGIAGIALSLVGWGLMLPIPGLPGDRVLQSVIGTKEMREGGTQTSIFMAVLLAMVVVFATAEWSPWVFLAFLAAWQRFNPDNVPQPVVLDEYEGLDERHRSRFVAIASIILLAGMPGAVPSHLMGEYVGGISVDSWEADLTIPREGSTNLSLEVTPSGVLPVSGWIQMRVEGPDAGDWSLDASCNADFSGMCEFSGATQSEPQEVVLRITPPRGEFSTHILRLLVEVSGFEQEHLVTLHSSNHTGPTQPFWEIVQRDAGRSEICTGMRAMQEGWSVVVEDPYWSLLNGTNLSQGASEVCLSGYQGAMESSGARDPQGRSLGPSLALENNGSTLGPWKMGIDGSGKLIQSSNGSWPVPPGFFEEGDVVFHSDTGSPFCPSSEVGQQIDTDGNWTTVLGNYSALVMHGDLTGEGVLGIGLLGWLAVCGEDGSVDSYRISPGEDVYVSAGLGSGIEQDEFEVTNRGQERMGVSVERYGDAIEAGIWELEIPVGVDPGSSVTVLARGAGDPNLERSVWVTADPSGITVHLSARCPHGGC